MNCQTCSHYVEKKYYGTTKPKWGLCKHLTSGEADKVEIYSNNRDGEWVETVVEVEPEFYCAEYSKGKEEGK